MDYWISSNDVQMGPYSLDQLQAMWHEGRLTADTYYYDEVQAQWALLGALVESIRGLFTVEEAFVRLGQNRQKGCLSVYNHEDTMHLFVDGGFVIYAVGDKKVGELDKKHGELALADALSMENSAYEWFFEAKPPSADLRLNIAEYALKHSIARDVRIGNSKDNAQTRKSSNTVALPKISVDKPEQKLKFTYILVADHAPTLNFRLNKLNNMLGREDLCDVVVDDRQVSRKHCLLEVWEQYVKIKDLDSSNGTFVNGVAVRDGFLNVGDQLGLGSYKLTLRKEQKKAPDLA
jgi:hypothetical protein